MATIASAMAVALLANAKEPHGNSFDLGPDVDFICTKVRQHYYYFQERAIYWDEACQRARSEAQSLTSRQGSLNVLERLLDDLYDLHVSLDTNNLHSPRLTSDLWFDVRKDGYVVTAIRPSSGAAEAGITIGDILIRFNGLTPEDLARSRIHSGLDFISEQRRLWAVNAAIAGRRDAPGNIKVRRDGDIFTFSLSDPDVQLPEPPISFEILQDKVGYIRFNDSLGEEETVPAFHTALETMKDTKDLILDMRSTPSGGDTSIAEPILGRFFKTDTAYQITVPKKWRPIPP